MEYATNISDHIPNDNFVKHVGYSSNYCTDKFFSKQNVDTISCKITELLQGVDPHNRPIIVPNKTIHNIMSSVYNNFKPEIGDMYSRFHIENPGVPNYIQKMIDQTINIIVTDVRNNLEMEEYNKTLSIWTTVRGDFNKHGLRSHPKIKLRERRIQPMMFNMNY